MPWLLTLYWICFGAGLLYVLAAGLLGAFSHGLHALGGHDAGGAESGGGDFDSADTADAAGQAGGIEAGDSGGNLDAGGAGDVEAADLDADSGGLEAREAPGHGAGPAADGHAGLDHAGIDYSPFSPLSVAGTLCGFGAGGLIASGLGWTQSLGLLGAIGGGTVSGLLLWLLIGKLLYSMQGSSEAHVADMIGLEAEVLTPLQPGATGEVAYILDGTRYTAPARMHGEGGAAQHETVRIRRLQDNVVYVERKRKLLE